MLFCVLYSVAFVYAFSTFGNFGILARERVQVLPMVLALLCLTRLERQARGPVLPTTDKTLVTS